MFRSTLLIAPLLLTGCMTVQKTGPEGEPPLTEQVPQSGGPQGNSPSAAARQHDAPPEGPDAPTEPALIEGCQHSESVVPDDPLPADGWCQMLHLDAEGAVRGRVERSAQREGEISTITTLTFDTAGELSMRQVVRTGPTGQRFRSVEHPQLAPDETLSYTYGEAATQSVTFTRDAAGRELSRRTDRAMDGIVNQERRHVFEGDTIVERTDYAEGELRLRSTFLSDGRPLLSLDAGDYGRVWRYDADGLLIRVERLYAGRITKIIEWKEAAPGVPLSRTALERTYAEDGSPIDTEIGGMSWSYDAQGVLTQDVSWRIVGRERRSGRTEYDASGRVVRLISRSASPDCRTYDQRTVYASDEGAQIASKRTTCDGRPFETVELELDSAGRVLRDHRVFYGNSRRSEREMRARFDACGALVEQQRIYNGELMTSEIRTLDGQGHVTAVDRVDRQGQASRVEFSWNDNNLLDRRTGAEFVRDDHDRLIAVNYDAPEIAPPTPLVARDPVGHLDVGPISSTRFRYDCE